MVVNPGKFQAMVISRFGKMENKHEMYIENKKITREHSVNLLGIEIDNQLNLTIMYQHYAKSRFTAKCYW